MTAVLLLFSTCKYLPTQASRISAANWPTAKAQRPDAWSWVFIAAGNITFYDGRTGSVADNTCDKKKEQRVPRQPWLYTQYEHMQPAPGSITSPPFHHPYSINPDAGDIVIFAPYIKHGVSAGNHPCVHPLACANRCPFAAAAVLINSMKVSFTGSNQERTWRASQRACESLDVIQSGRPVGADVIIGTSHPHE